MISDDQLDQLARGLLWLAVVLSWVAAVAFTLDGAS